MTIIKTSQFEKGENFKLKNEASFIELTNPKAEEVLREACLVDDLDLKCIVLRPDDSVPSVNLEKDELLEKFEKKNGTWIGLYTSGTTGIPKLHFHSIETIKSSVRSLHSGRVWGLLYPASRMAGLQVIFQAQSTRADIVEPKFEADSLEILQEFAQCNVDSLSLTPSRMKLFLSAVLTDKLKLRHISLGGEIADQRLLDVISDTFPMAELRHIYATTETGPVFSISDRREGFPVELLNRRLRSGKKLGLKDGELVISWNDPSQKKEITFHSGDLVRIDNDRVIFIGRRGDMVNVGGFKVSLTEIEKICCLVPGVLDAQALAVPNPFMGSIITVNLKWRTKPLDDLKIREILGKSLPKQALPAVINHVANIKLNDNYKKTRML